MRGEVERRIDARQARSAFRYYKGECASLPVRSLFLCFLSPTGERTRCDVLDEGRETGRRGGARVAKRGRRQKKAKPFRSLSRALFQFRPSSLALSLTTAAKPASSSLVRLLTGGCRPPPPVWERGGAVCVDMEGRTFFEKERKERIRFSRCARRLLSCRPSLSAPPVYKNVQTKMCSTKEFFS